MAASDTETSKGAGVSQAAGIQPFRGITGLFGPLSVAGKQRDMFDNDTFTVRMYA